MNRWILVAVIVAATAAGDILQSREMKRYGEVNRLGGVIAAVIRRKFLILAFACMTVSFFAFMSLVQSTDLSFAVPATAASFVLETILAKLILKERVDSRRWMGAALVALGVALLAL